MDQQPEDAADPGPPPRRASATRPGAVLGAIAVGGVLGAEARYGLGVVWPHPPTGWPWATLVINASGCLLIGVLMVLITERCTPHPLLRPFAGVGILGGYTTFSTYSVDVLTLAVHGRPVPALGYLVATPVSALVAVWLGANATRSVLAGRFVTGLGQSGGPA